MGASSTSAASREKGWAERPWKERVQSTWRWPSSRIRGSSARPDVRSVVGGWVSGEGRGGVVEGGGEGGGGARVGGGGGWVVARGVVDGVVVVGLRT